MTILLSCSSDDNTATPEQQESPPTNFLLGTWKAESFTFVCNSGASAEIFQEGCVEQSWSRYELGGNVNNVFEGVYRNEYYGEDFEGNCFLVTEIDGQWYLDGDLLLIVWNGIGHEYQVLDLTENSFRFMDEIEYYFNDAIPCSETDPGIRYTNYVKI